MNLIQVSWKSVWNKAWSSILSIILIAFGVGLLSLLVIFKNQFTEQFDRNQAGVDMVVGAKGSPLQLILNSMFHVDAPTGNISIEDAKFLFNPKNPYIQDAIPLSIGDSYKTFRIIGTDHSILKLYPTTISSGSLWDKSMSVTLGAEVAKETGLRIGDNFFSSHGFNEGDLEHDDAAPFVVVGILKPHGSVIDKLVLTNYTSIWEVHEGHNHAVSDSSEKNHEGHSHEAHSHEDNDHEHVDTLKQVSNQNPLLNFPDKSITSVLIRFAKDKKKTIPVINMPRNINENTPVMATSPTYQLNKLLENVGAGLQTLSYLAYLIAFISGMSIFISLYNNLKDRKYELAIMRVSGAKPAQLALMILFEALIVGVIGAIIGLLLAHTGIYVISNLLDSQFHYSLDFLHLYKEEIWIFIATMLISIVAGLLPAFKAYRTDIVKSLQ